MRSSDPRPTPGSLEFRRALIEVMEHQTGQSADELDLSPGQRVSRNTVIYRARVGDRRVVVKAQLTKPPAVVVAEYAMLRDMEHVLEGRSVRGLRPVAVYEELGALVTEEEVGRPLRDLLEAGCRRPVTHWPWAAAGVEAAARALREFHDAYAASAPPGAPSRSGAVRCYLDFSPKNLLMSAIDPELGKADVVLMDPPEEERWASRCEDVGGFCFDMTRIKFMPRNLGRSTITRGLDHLKALFIRRYFASADSPAGSYPLHEIVAAERRRASQALAWYLRPWRYRPRTKELARLAYLGPLTAYYRARGVRRSYRHVGRLLENVYRGDPASSTLEIQ